MDIAKEDQPRFAVGIILTAAAGEGAHAASK
jgi:hypothetical protein